MGVAKKLRMNAKANRARRLGAYQHAPDYSGKPKRDTPVGAGVLRAAAREKAQRQLNQTK